MTYYQRKIEEVIGKLEHQESLLATILTHHEYEIFSVLSKDTINEHSCPEQMDIIYKKMTTLLREEMFNHIKFVDICTRISELEKKPFGALYDCYQIDHTDYDNIVVKIESTIESLRNYNDNLDRLSEDLYDIHKKDTHPIMVCLYHLSELFGYLFYKHMESIISHEQHRDISNSYNQILGSIIDIQAYNPSLQQILNSASGEQLMTTIFSQEYLSNRDMTYWQSIFLMLGYVYLSLSWQSLDHYIRLVDQTISDETLGIEDTKYGYEDIIGQAKLSLLAMRDIYKSLQINQEYEENVTYCIGKMYRFIRDYQKTIIIDLCDAYQTLRYG